MPTTPKESLALAEGDARSTQFMKYHDLKPVDFEDRKPVLSLTSIPYMTNLKFHKFGACLCNSESHYHMDFLDFNSKGIFFFREDLKSSVEVCFNNYNLFDKHLPKGLGRKNFLQLSTFSELNNLLFRGTHWFPTFWEGKKPQRFVTRLAAFLTGVDPTVYGISYMMGCSLKEDKMRSFKNALANCDGILNTLFLFWEGRKSRVPTWGYLLRIQRFIIANCLDDYLLEVTSDQPTFYEKVKEVKNYIFGNVSKELPISRKGSPFPEIFFFKDVIDYFQEKLTLRSQVTKLRIIADTRSIGLPPPVMREKAYESFWKECVTPSSVPSKQHIFLMNMALDSILKDVEEGENLWVLFERSFQNEKISLSGSSDLESTAEEGGKIESANYYLKEALRTECPLIDLETGKSTGVIPTAEGLLANEYTPGQVLLSMAVQVYGRAVRQIQTGKFDENSNLFDVRAIAVSDQSKYRVATAGHFLYNVLLQPVAQVFKALFKSFESTKSGMEKQYHMWEFFKRIPREMLHYVRLPDKPGDVENVFFCEDWKKASDKFNKFQARIIVKKLMEWVGIPSAYRSVVDHVYALPKRVVIPDLVRDIPNTFIQLSGVFQGDPITKNVMQISHIVSRKIAKYALDFVAEKSHYQKGMQISGKKKESENGTVNYRHTQGGVPMTLNVFKTTDRVALLRDMISQPKLNVPVRIAITSELLKRVERQ